MLPINEQYTIVTRGNQAAIKIVDGKYNGTEFTVGSQVSIHNYNEQTKEGEVQCTHKLLDFPDSLTEDDFVSDEFLSLRDQIVINILQIAYMNQEQKRRPRHPNVIDLVEGKDYEVINDKTPTDIVKEI